MKEQTDKIILDSLKYSGRMFAKMVNLILILIGTVLLLSPLFLAGKNYWVAGIVFMGIAALRIYAEKRGKKVKLTDKSFYAVSIILQIAALILELLPFGAVLVFAAGPTETVTHTYSYFNLALVGYANFTPLLTGILSISIVILGIIALCRYDSAKKCKSAVFICSVIAAVLSLVPLLLFGSVGMTTISYIITMMMVFSVCLQAVANRKEYFGKLKLLCLLTLPHGLLTAQWMLHPLFAIASDGN